jgi:RimJ/RimL family protein N-acetyltransferase
VSAFPILQKPLTDGVVVLRPSQERDIPEVLIAYQDDPALHGLLGEHRPPSAAQLGRRSELAELERRHGSALTLALLSAQEGVCRGEVRVHSVDWQNLRTELSIWVSPRHRDAGLGRRALALSSHWLLTECGMERVGLAAGTGNRALLGAAAAAGFHSEGVLRGYVRDGERRMDTVVLSRVRRDLTG